MNLGARLQSAAEALGLEMRSARSAEAAVRALSTLQASTVSSYVVLSAVIAGTPEPNAVVTFTRRWRMSGLARAIAHVEDIPRSMSIRIFGGTVVDVTDTSASPYTTGIQRVARETSGRWVEWGAVLARWTDDERRLVGVADGEVIIAFRGSFVLPEISANARRTARLRTIGLYAAGRTAAIGFDCIPVTTSETAGVGMPGAFSGYLASLTTFDVVIPISDASAEEYRGWSTMLDGAGLGGPAIVTVPLPNSFASGATPASADETRAALGLGGDDIVLAVGSTEPRKNHLRLLAAAELAWRAGRRFNLVLVGGNAWNTEEFDDLMRQLRADDRPVHRLTRISDDHLAALYAMARFSVFPSINEGFGLPIVESIAAGTPVITSSYGSMRALAEGHGGVLVDPRSIHELSEAMLRLLDDEDELGRLRAATAAMPRGSWADYARDVWEIVRDS